MRAPVAVQVNIPLGPDRRWQLTLSAAFVLVALTQLIWWAGQIDAGRSPSFLLAATWLSLLTTGAIGHAFWRLRRPAAQVLRWTGQAWMLLASGSAPCVGRIDVAIDLGDWLLLRLHQKDGPDHWLPLAATRSKRHWHALRCALAASRHADAKARHDDAA